MSRSPVIFRCHHRARLTIVFALVAALAPLALGCGAASSGASTTAAPSREPATSPETSPEPATEPATPARRYQDCPAIACGGCSGGYATEPDGCPSCRCLFDSPAIQTAPGPGPAR